MAESKNNQYSHLAQARIKCTFVELYDEKGTRVFSLQKKAFGTGVIGITPNVSTKDAKGRVRLLLSSDVKDVLRTYITEIVKTGNGPKAGVTALKSGLDKYYYVYPSACTWETIDPSVIPTVTPDGTVVPGQTTGLSTKTKLALAAAAMVALFGN